MRSDFLLNLIFPDIFSIFPLASFGRFGFYFKRKSETAVDVYRDATGRGEDGIFANERKDNEPPARLE